MCSIRSNIGGSAHVQVVDDQTASRLQLRGRLAQTEPLVLALRGKPNPVTAHRLMTLDAAATGVARHLDRPMVGRKRELDRMAADFSDAAASRTTRLFTLMGPAGVGKSRLVADFLTRVGDNATVARGRALSYGDGITYWAWSRSSSN